MKNKYLTLVDQHAIGVAGNLTAKQAEAMKTPMKREIEPFEVGDTVDVHQWIEFGEKGRTQIFSGTVIAKRGSGPQEAFTVRRIVQGEGVERVFPLHSPKIVKLEVKRRGRTRRAKLYYLRDRVGKATRVQERKKGTEKPAAAAPSAPAATTP
jgi:large subunit ribosomal protein L19